MCNKFKKYAPLGLFVIFSFCAFFSFVIKSNAKLSGQYANYAHAMDSVQNTNDKNTGFKITSITDKDKIFELFTGRDGIDPRTDWLQRGEETSGETGETGETGEPGNTNSGSDEETKQTNGGYCCLIDRNNGTIGNGNYYNADSFHSGNFKDKLTAGRIYTEDYGFYLVKNQSLGIKHSRQAYADGTFSVEFYIKDFETTGQPDSCGYDYSTEQYFFSFGYTYFIADNTNINGNKLVAPKLFGIVLGSTADEIDNEHDSDKHKSFNSIGIRCGTWNPTANNKEGAYEYSIHWCKLGELSDDDNKVDLKDILSDALISVTYNAAPATNDDQHPEGELKCYLNGMNILNETLRLKNDFTTDMDTAPHTEKDEPINNKSNISYVKIGSDTDQLTICFRSIRIYGLVLCEEDIKTNYKVDLSIYKTKPTWEAYKAVDSTGHDYLTGYYAGEDPQITDYEGIINMAGAQKITAAPTVSAGQTITGASFIPITTPDPDASFTGNPDASDMQIKIQTTSKPANLIWNNQAYVTPTPSPTPDESASASQDNSSPAPSQYASKNSAVNDDIKLELKQSGRISKYYANYLDLDGYHSYFQQELVFGQDLASNYNIVSDINGKSFTFEFAFGDFVNRTGVDVYLFQLNNGSKNANTNFSIIYTQEDANKNRYLQIKVPCGSSRGDITGSCPAISYKIDSLKDTTISIAFYDGSGNTTNNTSVELFVNGVSVAKTVADTSDNTKNIWSHDWTQAYLGSQPGGANYVQCTYRCIRFYSGVALDPLQIINNYSNDCVLYYGYPTKQTVPTFKSEHNYGIVGFDNLLHTYQNKNKEITDCKDEDKNELYKNGEWTVSSKLRVTKEERLKYFIASLNDYKTSGDNGVYVSTRAPKNVDKRATIYSIWDIAGTSLRGSSSDPNLKTTGTDNKTTLQTNLSKVLVDNVSNTNNYDNLESENTVNNINVNGAIVLQNSFYIRSQNKCGDSLTTTSAYNGGDIENSAKLMVTADIYSTSLKDADFCGIVIDYSDKIWNKYNQDDDYSGYTANPTGKTRDDTMYTNFDQAARADKSAMFETGVGFTLLNKNNGSQNVMRVFVGGDGTTDGTPAQYLDVISNTNPDWQQGMSNFSVYREYTTWHFGSFTDLVHNDTLNNDDKVYLVKFYVNKSLVAMVAMKVTGFSKGNRYEKGLWTKHTNEAYNFLKCEGFSGIFKVTTFSSTGIVVDEKTAVTGCCNFKDWFDKCNYGVDGHDSKMDGFGTASGNILFALHRENNEFKDGSDGIYGYRQTKAEDELCRVVLDNIGYMDYHDSKNQATFSQNYTINKDMSNNLVSELIFARKLYEPTIYFNRLAYDTTTLTAAQIYSEIFLSHGTKQYSALRDYLWTNGITTANDYGTYNNIAVKLADFNAAHGRTKLYDLDNLTDSYIWKYGYSVNGVYFKDIADEITYDWIDFNGETMFTKKLSAIDYFQAVYNQYIDAVNAGKDAPPITENQANLLIDLIDLGHDIQIHDGYNKCEGITTITNVKASTVTEGVRNYNGDPLSVHTIGQIISKYNNGISGITVGPEGHTWTISNPKIAKNDKDYSYENAKFLSYTLTFKNYVGLLVKIQFNPGTSGKTIQDCLTITDNLGNKITKWVDLDNTLTSYNKENVSLFKQEGNIISIEIPLELTDFNKQYTFMLTDPTTMSSDSPKQIRLKYGVYCYCNAMWNEERNYLDDLVKRLYHIGQLAQYWNTNDSFSEFDS